ncbi:MAG: precorrin-2 dehydrogenase/sirohydrochlorin ferrochelatase family protein [Flavicella sp.]
MRNQLYPIFLKVTELNTLIVGGGNVALEKLTFLLKSSPDAKVQMVSPMFREETVALAEKHGVEMIVAPYATHFLENKHIVIATTDMDAVNKMVHKDCKERNILVNLADNPPFCDFYMGGIVTKGNVKVAISTNGKSPTMAKRLRQFFEDVLPEDINELAENLNEYRKTIKGDFEQKVEALNEFTKGLVSKKK